MKIYEKLNEIFKKDISIEHWIIWAEKNGFSIADIAQIISANTMDNFIYDWAIGVVCHCKCPSYYSDCSACQMVNNEFFNSKIYTYEQIEENLHLWG